jgi:hypothetical protein
MSNFAATVLSRLPITDPQDLGLMLEHAARLGEEGWTCDEVVSLLRNTEEVNPDLSEEIALRRMATIRSNVEKRLKLERKR